MKPLSESLRSAAGAGGGGRSLGRTTGPKEAVLGSVDKGSAKGRPENKLHTHFHLSSPLVIPEQTPCPFFTLFYFNMKLLDLDMRLFSALKRPTRWHFPRSK